MVAGSTVLLLTIIWGSCVVAGKFDLVGSFAQDAQDTKGFNLTGTYFKIFFFPLIIYL